jgi:glycopeptide antibiotics resistance protein
MANVESIFAIGVILIFLFLYVIEIEDLNVNTLGILAGFLLCIVLFSNIG